MILASYGQLFTSMEKARKIRQNSNSDEFIEKQLLPLIDSMLAVYQPSIVNEK